MTEPTTTRTPSPATQQKRASSRFIDAHAKWQKARIALDLAAQRHGEAVEKAGDRLKAAQDKMASYLTELNDAATHAKALGVPIEMPTTE